MPMLVFLLLHKEKKIFIGAIDQVQWYFFQTYTQYLCSLKTGKFVNTNLQNCKSSILYIFSGEQVCSQI